MPQPFRSRYLDQARARGCGDPLREEAWAVARAAADAALPRRRGDRNRGDGVDGRYYVLFWRVYLEHYYVERIRIVRRDPCLVAELANKAARMGVAAEVIRAAIDACRTPPSRATARSLEAA